ncbi:MAG: hypothetical protein U0T84_02890 [Chitinophagales bacterium]
MMKNRIIAISAVALVALLFSCKKTAVDNTSEPITIVEPDSVSVRRLPGFVQNIQIKFTTDRPIQYVKGMYELDSAEIAGHVYTYPDTLFYTVLDSPGVTTKVNKYTYNGSYHVPDTLLGGEVIRFQISMQAKNDAASSVLNYTKEFKIGVK